VMLPAAVDAICCAEQHRFCSNSCLSNAAAAAAMYRCSTGFGGRQAGRGSATHQQCRCGQLMSCIWGAACWQSSVAGTANSIEQGRKVCASQYAHRFVWCSAGL
jgi:hypothetical protein